MSESAAEPIRLAVCIVTLPDGRWALQRRTKDAPIAGGKLGLFGGHIELGEQPDAAIRRELAEETSLDIDSLNIEFIEEIHHPVSRYDGRNILFYLYKTNIPVSDFEVYEGDGAEMYALEELVARDDLSEVVEKLAKRYAGQN